MIVVNRVSNWYVTGIPYTSCVREERHEMDSTSNANHNESVRNKKLIEIVNLFRWIRVWVCAWVAPAKRSYLMCMSVRLCDCVSVPCIINVRYDAIRAIIGHKIVSAPSHTNITAEDSLVKSKSHHLQFGIQFVNSQSVGMVNERACTRHRRLEFHREHQPPGPVDCT